MDLLPTAGAFARISRIMERRIRRRSRSGCGRCRARLRNRREATLENDVGNTDFDLQLKKHGVQQLIIMALIAHTCLEGTVRFALELGYGVAVVRDATADYSDEQMHAALEVNIPRYA